MGAGPRLGHLTEFRHDTGPFGIKIFGPNGPDCTLFRHPESRPIASLGAFFQAGGTAGVPKPGQGRGELPQGALRQRVAEPALQFVF